MTSLLLLIPAVLAVFALSGVLGHFDKRVSKHGIHALTWRWLTASGNWTGKPVTNRGLTRPGTKALTPTGHAHRRWYLPRWQHAAWRIQWTLVTLLTSASLLVRFRSTVSYLGVTAAAGAGYGAWRTWAWAQEYTHRRSYVKPLHVRLAAKAGIPVANHPDSWVDVPRDLSYARLTWPKNSALPEPQDRQAIEAVTASTLGMRNPKAKWQFTGPRLGLTHTPPVPPPARVALADIRQAIIEADVDDLILGVGEDGKIVKVSLHNDAPHLGLSMDSGKGKSVSVRCIVPQVLFRGGIALILDNKLVSHPWA